MAKWQNLAIFALQLAVAGFWIVVVTITQLIQWARLGNDFWKTKPHPKPKVLDGWKEDFVQLQDVRLHYVWAGDKTKPLLLLVHGFPEFWYSWRYQIKFFEKFFYVVAIDMRGYNDSSKPPNVSDYKISNLVRDLKETIEALGEFLRSKERAYVAAHDWGAAVSWRLAMHHPEVVEKLIILNVPHPSAFKSLLRADIRQMSKSWYMYMFQFPRIPEASIPAQDYRMLEESLRNPKKGGIRNAENFTDDDLEAWKHVYAKSDAFRGPINYYRAIFRHPETGEPPKVKPETLIIWGTEDAFLQKEGAAQSPRFCEKARVEFIEGASHWVQQDAPNQVNQLMKEFLVTK